MTDSSDFCLDALIVVSIILSSSYTKQRSLGVNFCVFLTYSRYSVTYSTQPLKLVFFPVVDMNPVTRNLFSETYIHRHTHTHTHTCALTYAEPAWLSILEMPMVYCSADGPD